ncbi:hypothetical protein AAFP30_04250 [Gordonia sp. CPCC 205515]|uniref:hypothetical protein n=1 Tax=Gordonia sp. CPCC 205515 TaxID=3140791 RepID=UPI003AF38FA7
MTIDDGAPTDPLPRAERRWTASAFVLVSMAVPFLLPGRYSPGIDYYLPWLFPAIEGVVLVALIILDPGRIDQPGRWVRTLSLILVAAIASGAAWSAARLLWDLLHGNPQTTVATELLISGALVWLQTIIAFAFLYWETDNGGPVSRHLRHRERADLVFPQQLSPELAAPGWRPIYFDYLYLALNNATAFSPTDVIPFARWAKLAMALQSILSIMILSLVVANAVNLLG